MFYQSVIKAKQAGRKQLAVLIDPDKTRLGSLDRVIRSAVEAGVDYFFIGGSLILDDKLEACIAFIKEYSEIPVILFPGNTFQISNKADAILFLSLISGRNAELLIGKHVVVAPYLKRSGLEIVPTGYMLVDGGAPTTASYISNSQPIPANKTEIAVCTAMAGEMLGMKILYLDAGSGAPKAISEEMIHAVADSVEIPIIVGGGIGSAEKVYRNAKAGADLMVIGNSLEANPALIHEMIAALNEAKSISDI
jgi:putative glycerol-1-phosphate prenyltransferase